MPLFSITKRKNEPTLDMSLMSPIDGIKFSIEEHVNKN